MSDPEQLISIAECARLLEAAGDKVSRPTLTEYCDTHSLKREWGGKTKRVYFSEVQNHRQQNGMRTIMRGEGLLEAQAPEAPPEKTGQESPAAPKPAAPRLPTLEERRKDPVFRRKESDAEIAQLELEQKRGNLVVRAEVEAGIADMFSELRAAEARNLGPAAEALTTKLGLDEETRQIVKVALKKLVRAVQSDFHNEAANQVARLGDESRTDAMDRLMAMAALSHKMRLQSPSTPSVSKLA